MATSPTAIDPHEALARLLARVAPVGVETLSGDAAAGRVLAEPLRLDRDSPACDVSAMDGFAVRHDELLEGPLPVVGERRPGERPEPAPSGQAVRIYTGAPVPEGADTVLRLERGVVEGETLALAEGAKLSAGADIRRRGENASAGSVVLESGAELTPAAIGAVATVGPAELSVYRRLKIAVITTGDELTQPSEACGALPPWRLRDSNGPTLVAMLGGAGWVESVEPTHANDTLEEHKDQLASAVERCDAVVLTGGVSKGAHDQVRPAIEALGGEVVFHRVRARPGQPTLGAMLGPTPVVGLPGNPLAVLCAGRRLLVPVLRQRAGLADCDPPAPRVTLDASSGVAQQVAWWRPVSLSGPGRATLASLRGSGDVCGPAATDGFVEVPAGADGEGPFAFYPWCV